jgi:hypothetical protein
LSGFQHPPRPRAVAAGNAVWGAAQRAGIARTSLAEDSLIRAARRSSGLHDFVDDSFREPMRRVLEALETEAQLHPIGRVTMRHTLIRTLVNRLRLELECDLHPEIRDWPVTSPVFIVGVQRTGTTLLHRLLTCEPSLRPLLSWEALNPAPYPGTTEFGGRDPRMRLAEMAERGARYMAPQFFAIHPIEAHEPEEDVLVMDLSFFSPTVEASMRVPDYAEWFQSVDQRPAYRYLKRVIQLLLWQRDGRYLGKTPHHLEQLDALLEVFPDAKIIQTHRDPMKVVPSFCSMMTHGRRIFSDAVDPREVGAQLSEKAVRAVNGSMAARERLGPESFLDVAYRDLVSDPLKEIRRIYDFIGTDFGPEAERSMQGWLGQNPQNKHGVHRYQLSDFGIDRDELNRRFGDYRERFGIEPE